MMIINDNNPDIIHKTENNYTVICNNNNPD